MTSELRGARNGFNAKDVDDNDDDGDKRATGFAFQRSKSTEEEERKKNTVYQHIESRPNYVQDYDDQPNNRPADIVYINTHSREEEH